MSKSGGCKRVSSMHRLPHPGGHVFKFAYPARISQNHGGELAGAPLTNPADLPPPRCYQRGMSAKQHLYLVDGSSYIFRAYHRLPPLTNPEGTPVGAVYGYTTMLWKLADDLHKADGPTHLAVVLDAGSRSFRNEIFAAYKANRPPPPEDLVPQFPLIRDATRKTGSRRTISSHPMPRPRWPLAGRSPSYPPTRI